MEGGLRNTLQLILQIGKYNNKVDSSNVDKILTLHLP